MISTKTRLVSLYVNEVYVQWGTHHKCRPGLVFTWPTFKSSNKTSKHQKQNNAGRHQRNQGYMSPEGSPSVCRPGLHTYCLHQTQKYHSFISAVRGGASLQTHPRHASVYVAWLECDLRHLNRTKFSINSLLQGVSHVARVLCLFIRIKYQFFQKDYVISIEQSSPNLRRTKQVCLISKKT